MLRAATRHARGAETRTRVYTVQWTLADERIKHKRDSLLAPADWRNGERGAAKKDKKNLRTNIWCAAAETRGAKQSKRMCVVAPTLKHVELFAADAETVEQV
jgi:hypothetical protein